MCDGCVFFVVLYALHAQHLRCHCDRSCTICRVFFVHGVLSGHIDLSFGLGGVLLHVCIGMLVGSPSYHRLRIMLGIIRLRAQFDRLRISQLRWLY